MSALLDRLFAELSQQAPVRVDLPDHPHAAVALLLAPDPDRLLLIRRADRAGDPWSGQLALPGGRREPHDVDLLHTAIRETAEETGLHLDRQWHRADLDDLAPMTPVLPPIVVRPFAFQLAEALAAGLSAEVAGVAWVPLATLAAPEVYREAEIEVRGVPRTVRGYHLEGGLLWGMTERIVTPIVARWRAISGR
ncbi:MAG: CoA pyrophosphatase [Gemmatimonadetes bacterium]|nr:CoA pyrophosphatase [Gemmatimonadota bacterium]MBK9549273.1 CoA pyrophosphatase [Gemmatimonadota bacterium]